MKELHLNELEIACVFILIMLIFTNIRRGKKVVRRKILRISKRCDDAGDLYTELSATIQASLFWCSSTSLTFQ